MKILELFAGTGSVGKVAKQLGYEVTSLDITEKYSKVDILIDILEWDYKIYQPKHFDIIWASPPCDTFSKLQDTNRHKTAEEKLDRIYKIGLPLLYKSLEIITYLQPKYYIIENPQTGKMKDFLKLPFVDIDYCKFGFNYRKRTRFWTNIKNLETVKCLKNNPCESRGKTNRHPIRICYYNSSKLKERYSIPSNLIEYLFKSCV